MTMMQGCDEVVTRVRRRIEDTEETQFTTEEVLDAIDEARTQLAIEKSLVGRDHEAESLLLAPTAFTAVANRTNTNEYVLPEYVGQIMQVEGVRPGGRRVDVLEQGALDYVHSMAGPPSWHLHADRPGTIRLYGRLTGYQTVNIWFQRRHPPLHYGTAAAGAATTIDFGSDANTTGTVLQRDDLYVGMDLLVTNDSPAGALGQLRRITSYTGATRRATVAAWTTAPDATTTYALAVPLAPEHYPLLVEEAALILHEDLGDAMVSPRLERLRAKFTADLRERARASRKVWNYGRG